MQTLGTRTVNGHEVGLDNMTGEDNVTGQMRTTYDQIRRMCSHPSLGASTNTEQRVRECLRVSE